MQKQKVSIEFIFGDKNSNLSKDINSFWRAINKSYEEEMQSHRQATLITQNAKRFLEPGNITTLKREPAALAKDQDGSILGIVLVALTKIESSSNSNEYVYFQRMYTKTPDRHFSLSNQLYTSFLRSFRKAINKRDSRAHFLMAENANPRLRTPSMRRYFFRLGFRMLGTNHLGYEIWRLPLETNDDTEITSIKFKSTE